MFKPVLDQCTVIDKYCQLKTSVILMICDVELLVTLTYLTHLQLNEGCYFSTLCNLSCFLAKLPVFMFPISFSCFLAPERDQQNQL